MTEKEQKESINAQQPDTPDVKPKHAGGRPRDDEKLAPINEAIDLTAPKAMDLLSRYIFRKKGYLSLSRDLIEACKYVIDHAIGKARQKVEHSGGIMTYGDISKSANATIDKPRPVLADALEIAQQHQEELNKPEKDGKASLG